MIWAVRYLCVFSSLFYEGFEDILQHIACVLLSIALPSETKLIDYRHRVFTLERLEALDVSCAETKVDLPHNNNILVGGPVLSDTPSLALAWCPWSRL